MPDDLASLILPRRPTPERPLLGLTVLIVEDSRFASEALRLLCLRSGARIRRADCLCSARRHLAIYRPATIIVDMGLPDGSGADLIREVVGAGGQVPVLLGTSGDIDAEELASASGAHGFLQKPVSSLAEFQQAILAHLSEEDQPPGLRCLASEQILPDQFALREDLSHVATILSEPVDAATLEYAIQFVSSLAQSAEDKGVAAIAGLLRKVSDGLAPAEEALSRISTLVAAKQASCGPL